MSTGTDTPKFELDVETLELGSLTQEQFEDLKWAYKHVKETKEQIEKPQTPEEGSEGDLK